MIIAHQLAPGMSIVIQKRPYRVESAVKVTAQKANPFIKCKLKDLATQEIIEKNFKPTQEVGEVALEEHKLEYLYPEGKTCVFLDTGTLDVMKVPSDVIGKKRHYLKEGIEVKASCYEGTIFTVELPQFLELMVTAVETEENRSKQEGSVRRAQLETGAFVEVPPFVDVGDIVKVDTRLEEYIQRV